MRPTIKDLHLGVGVGIGIEVEPKTAATDHPTDFASIECEVAVRRVVEHKGLIAGSRHWHRSPRHPSYHRLQSRRSDRARPAAGSDSVSAVKMKTSLPPPVSLSATARRSACRCPRRHRAPRCRPADQGVGPPLPVSTLASPSPVKLSPLAPPMMFSIFLTVSSGVPPTDTTAAVAPLSVTDTAPILSL